MPRPASRCSGAMPRFWIAPMPVRSRTPCTVPQYSVPPTGPRRAGEKPGGLRQEARLANNLAHQSSAAVQLAEARKHVGVDLAPKTHVLGLGKGPKSDGFQGTKR